jgi:hypothetical protein
MIDEIDSDRLIAFPPSAGCAVGTLAAGGRPVRQSEMPLTHQFLAIMRAERGGRNTPQNIDGGSRG